MKNKLYETIIFMLLIWTVLQDFCLSLFLRVTDQVMLTKILFFMKDFLLVTLFIWSLFRINKFKFHFLLGLGLYFFIIFLQICHSFLLNNIEITTILSSIRSLIILPCFLCIGLAIKNKTYFYQKVKAFMFFLVICAVIGIMEYLVDVYVFSTIPFWTNGIEIGNYMTEIKEQGIRLYNGLPGNFYGQYGGEFFSQKRLVSFWGSPLTAAYVLAIPFFYFLANFLRRGDFPSLLYFLICFVAIYMTHTRAIFLQVLVFAVIMPFIMVKKVRKYYLLFIPIAIFALIFFYDRIYEFIYDGSTMEHIRQFTQSFLQLSFLGAGIGTFGVDAAINTESAFISCFGQIGFIGFVLYLIFNSFFFFILLKYSLKKKTNKYMGFIFLIITMIVTGFISEQLFAYTSSCPYFVLMGFLYSFFKNGGVNNEENSLYF